MQVIPASTVTGSHVHHPLVLWISIYFTSVFNTLSYILQDTILEAHTNSLPVIASDSTHYYSLTDNCCGIIFLFIVKMSL